MFKGVGGNTLVSVVMRTLGLVLAFFSLGLVTRYLGPENAGAYFTVFAYVGIFGVVADLGLYQILLRDMSRPEANERSIFSQFFSLRVVSTLLILGILSPTIAIFLPYPPTVKFGVILGSLLFICLSLTTLFIAVFQKHLHMHVVALGEFTARVIQLILIILLFKAGYGVLAALGAALVGSVVQLAIVAVYARKHIPYRFTPDVVAWKGILRISYPIALSTIFSFIYFKIDTVMLSFFKPAYDVGIYGLAYKILEMLVAYPAIYVGLLVPVISRAFVADREEFFRTTQKAFNMLLFIALPLLFGGVALAFKIIPIFGQGYDSAAPTLIILLGATAIIFFGTLYSNMLIVVERQKTLAHIYFWGMIGNIAANFYVIPRWSYIGAAWTTLLTEMGVTIAMIVLLKKYNWFHTDFARVPRIILSCLGMAAFLFILRTQPLWLLLPLGVTSYLVLAALFKTAQIGELKEVVVSGK